jgi:UDP-N-acetylmuramoyl-tripeptide--D-alanyl-D-alanine ligase
VANRDDPEVVRVTERWAGSRGGGRVIWYGLEERSRARPGVGGRDVRAATLADGRPGLRFRLEIDGASEQVELPLHGRYNAANALAAAGVAHALGLTLEEIRRGLARARPGEHRGVVHRLESGIVLVDDSYNSNPGALAEALESAAQGWAPAPGPAPSRPGRRVAILGDMLELGPEAGRFHREAGRRAAELGFDPVVGVGPLAEGLVVGAQAGGAEAIHLEDAAAAADWAERCLRPGDLVLVKGSRGIGLDRVVERVLAHRRGTVRGDS